MPGNNSSPCLIFCIRFFRISSLTESTLYPLSRNSPIVRGRVVMVIPLSCYLSWGLARAIHVRDRGDFCQSCILHVPTVPETGGTICILPSENRKRKCYIVLLNHQH